MYRENDFYSEVHQSMIHIYNNIEARLVYTDLF